MYRFNIADLSVAINADRRYVITDAYKDFYDSVSGVSKNIDFSVDVYTSKKTSRSGNGSVCLFNSGGAWTLYKDKADRYIVVSGNKELMIDKQMSHGELYANSLNIDGKHVLPFSYPLDILLVINLLTKHSGIVVHASGVDDNGRGFVFLGTSGAGKSTTARLWLKQTSPPLPPFTKGGQGGIMKGVKVLSDDRIIIREIGDAFFAYGTPWHGEVNVCDPGKVGMEKIFFLEHSDKNYAKLLSAVDAATRMLVRCFPPFWDREGMESTLLFIGNIVKNVPCYELGFVPDKSAVSFVRGLR